MSPEEVAAIDESQEDTALREMVEQAVRRAQAGEAAETESLELKLSFYANKDGILKTVVGFANRASLEEPGHLVIGVTDEGEVVGVDADVQQAGGTHDGLELAIRQYVASGLGEGLPPPETPVHFVNVEGQSVVVIVVPPGPYRRNLYVTRSNKCYIRRGAASVPLDNLSERDQYAERRATELDRAEEEAQSPADIAPKEGDQAPADTATDAHGVDAAVARERDTLGRNET